MSAMAAMDPSNQLAALYGYGMNPAMLSGIPGMDMFLGTKAKTSTSNTPTTAKANSPRASPRPPSRASAKSDDHRRSPKTSSANPRTSTPSTSLSSAAAALGLDPKLLAGIDPNMLKLADGTLGA